MFLLPAVKGVGDFSAFINHSICKLDIFIHVSEHPHIVGIAIISRRVLKVVTASESGYGPDNILGASGQGLH